MSDKTVPNQGNIISRDTQLLIQIVIAAVTQEYEALKTYLHNAFEQDISPVSLYEALLQTYLFAGFPAALESLTVLSQVVRERPVHNDGAKIQPVREVYNVPEFRSRGEALCKQIYTSAFDKMTALLEQSSPELHEWMIIEGYGKTLSRDGLHIIIRELLNVAVLAVLGWERQLYSHLRGAINVGATAADCRAVLDLLPETTRHQEQLKHKAIQILQHITISFINKQSLINKQL